MRKLINSGIHSNIYLSIGALSLAYVSFVLLKMSFRWEPLFIAFSGTFFLYNLNRLTDKKEDEINYPERSKFVKKYGGLFFKFGFFLYGLSIFLSLYNGIYTFCIALIPLILVILYSVFRLKKILYVKNVIVAVGWGTISFLVGSYSNVFSLEILLIFLFIFIRSLIQSIIFDIKDVTGDGFYKINTIPKKHNIERTKNILLILNTIFAFYCIFLIYSNLLIPTIFLLSFVAFYSYFYILAVGKVEIKILCEIADGEDILLGILALLSTLVW